MAAQKLSILAYEWLPECTKNINEALSGTSELIFQKDPKLFQKEISRKQYDVIFLGVAPNHSTVFKLLRQTHSQTPHTPIIITSTSEKAELVVKAIKLGAYDFITIPFTPSRIQLAVQKAIK